SSASALRDCHCRHTDSAAAVSPTRSTSRFTWAWMDLNHRPLPYQGSALTRLSYRPQVLDEGISPALCERDLDTADEVGAHVVNERGQRRERREQNDVDEADDKRDDEHPSEAHPGNDAAAALRTLDVT